MAKKKVTYDSAYQELEQIIEEIQGDKISIDIIAEKVKRSKELLAICRNKLREYKAEIEKD